MKPLILKNFNDTYQLMDVEKPVAGKSEVLVKIKSSGVNPLDLKIMAGTGKITPQVNQTEYTLATIEDAYRAQTERSTSGKLVIEIK